MFTCLTIKMIHPGGKRKKDLELVQYTVSADSCSGCNPILWSESFKVGSIKSARFYLTFTSLMRHYRQDSCTDSPFKKRLEKFLSEQKRNLAKSQMATETWIWLWETARLTWRNCHQSCYWSGPHFRWIWILINKRICNYKIRPIIKQSKLFGTIICK